MATLADSVVPRPVSSGLAAIIDRWIYVFMAGLFLVTIFVGFIPDSFKMVGEAQAGLRPPLPAVLHVHAVLMGSWIALLLSQTVLMATNRPALHQKLGMVSVLLAPALVIVGFLLVPAMRIPLAEVVKTGPPELAASLRPILDLTMNIVLLQIRIGVGFAVLLTIGLLARRTDSGLHKRLMILATAQAMPAAIDRITWMPSTMPTGALSVDIGMLAIISPMLLWDIYRLRTVPRAYLVWFAVNLPLTIFVHVAWGTAWWRATALGMMGISGV